jgi:uncharacterized protein (DUF1330 family)
MEKTSMAVLLLSFVRVDDPVRYARYAELATKAAARYGGKFLVRGAPLEVMEQAAMQPNRAVALWFADADGARSYYNSPEYQTARQERLGAAQFEMLMVAAPEELAP